MNEKIKHMENIAEMLKNLPQESKLLITGYVIGRMERTATEKKEKPPAPPKAS